MTKTQVWVLVIGILLIAAVACGMVAYAVSRPFTNFADIPEQISEKIDSITHPTPTIYPDPVTGRLEYVDTGMRSGNCTLTCHGVRHFQTAYER